MSNQNSSNNRRITEDVPQMRSVRIQQPLVAPTMPFGLSAVGSTKATTTVIPSSSSSKPLLQVWNINKALPMVPSYYKFERTHVKIGDAPVQDIAQRIVSCLRDESVAATFDHEQAMVEAETHDGVFFTTRLFQQDDSKVVVEMQRQAGCCFLFQQTARCVLRAAKGMPPPSCSSTTKTPTPKRCLPAGLPMSSPNEERLDLEQGLEMASGLLKKDKLDAHLLAMESLTQLSRTTQCECHVAKTILTGPLLETLVSLIESWTICKQDGSEEGDKGELEEQHCASMHRLAMSVLANCLSTLEASGELGKVLEQGTGDNAVECQLCSPSLLMALSSELRQASSRPHDACEAARCLKALVKNCPRRAKPCLLNECDGLGATAMALDTGRNHHAKLEEECRRLSLQINSAS